MRGRRKYILAVFLLALLGLSAAAYFWLFAGLPAAEVTADRLQAPSVKITDREGRLLYEDLPETGGRHQSLPLDAIPDDLLKATIATEDSHFYINPGIDLTGILRAAWINLKGGETLAGGSTITQQVVRTLLFDEQERGQRSLRRKLREALLAWQITQRYSKDEILALYLNQSYYGGLAYGVEAAAQTYFGKPASGLSLAECALLAGLPQAPAVYDPFSNPQAALHRRSSVLLLMEKAGYLSAEERSLAEREPLTLASSPYPMEAPHFVLMARAQVDSLFTPEEIAASGGLTVRTTLDLDAQRAAEQAVTNHLERLKEKGMQGLGYNVNNAALVALDPRTGEIVAMVGSPDFADEAHNGAINMTLFPRQPGSALKPFIYAAAFDPTRPQPWTAATSILDVRTNFVTHDDMPYTPANYDGLEHGPVLARQALGSSLNIPAVLTLQEVGIPTLIDLGSRLGFSLPGDPDRYDLSVALGGGEVRLLDLTAAYGAFASGGYRVEPYAILDTRDVAGNTLYEHTAAPPRRVLDERVAWLITDILSDDQARKIGFGLHSILNLDRPAAVKTGTTTNYHDNWTVGYTPNLVVGVWVGNASHEGMREVNGLTGAGPIWHQAMRGILAGQPRLEFQRPDGLVQAEVCALSGLLPTPDCPYRRLEWFIEGTEPQAWDTYYRSVTLDSATGRLADELTPPERRAQTVALNLPPAAQGWARINGLLLWSDLQRQAGMAVERSAAADEQEEGLFIVSPAALTSYHLADTLPRSAQRIPVEAAGSAELAEVTLWIDGRVIAILDAPPYRTFWELEPGEHEVWAEGRTAGGKTLESPRARFQVFEDQ